MSSLLFSCAIYQAKKIPENNIQRSLESNKEKTKKTVLFLGDSLTHGRVSYDYVSQIKKNPRFKDFNIINEGINSRLTNQILEILDDVEKIDPDLIFILIGTNDLKASLNETEYKRYQSLWSLTDPINQTSFINNLSNIVEKLKTKTKGKIVLISIPMLGENSKSNPYIQSKIFANSIKQISFDRKANYLPLFESLESELIRSENTKTIEYSQNQWNMYWTILKYYSTTKTWNDLSEDNGYYLLTDGIHLNERSGKILENMILKEMEFQNF
jgi:lysophospholipase L1-like esterase